MPTWERQGGNLRQPGKMRMMRRYWQIRKDLLQVALSAQPGPFINPLEANVTVCDAITWLVATQKHDVSVILSEAKDRRRFFAALRMTAHPDE